MIHRFGWRTDDCDKLAAGTIAGRIVECGGRNAQELLAAPSIGHSCPRHIFR